MATATRLNKQASIKSDRPFCSDSGQSWRYPKALPFLFFSFPSKLVLFLFFSFLSAVSLHAQESSPSGKADPPAAMLAAPPPTPPIQKHLLGEWGGIRGRLAEDEGISFDFHYIADLLANPHGGKRRRETGWGRIRGTMDVDMGKMANMKGLTFHISGIWQFGVNLGENLGSLANPSSIVSGHSTRLESFWFQQALFNDKLFVRAGQFGGQDFYGVQEYGGSHLLEPVGYALGNLFNTFESFDPASTPAVEVRVAPTKNIYVKSALLAGNRDPFGADPNGLHYKIKDSAVVVSEVGYLVDPPGSGRTSSGKSYPGSYKLGSSYNGGKFKDHITEQQDDGNYLIYFMANQAVYRSEAGSSRGLDLHLAFDRSPKDVNVIHSQFTWGARYNGLIPNREDDSLAIAAVHSLISDDFNSARRRQGKSDLGSETALELSYRARLTPWLVLQPTVQYYLNVGGAHNGNAVVAGFRTIVSF